MQQDDEDRPRAIDNTVKSMSPPRLLAGRSSSHASSYSSQHADDALLNTWDLVRAVSASEEDSLQQPLLLGSPLTKGRRSRRASEGGGGPYPLCGPSGKLAFLPRILPFLEWLPRYTKTQFFGDLIGGFTVAIMVIPQGMSYAVLAELPPVYGLFCAITGPIIYAFLGTSRHLSIGPVALVSLSLPRVYEVLGIYSENMTDDEASAARVQAAMSISFVAGTVLLILSILRLGLVSHFIPPAVMVGFTNAAALAIGISQIKELLGIKVPTFDYTWQSCTYVLGHLPDGQLASAIMGLCCIIFLLGAKRIKEHFDRSSNQRIKDWMKIIYPFCNLLLVVTTAIIADILVHQDVNINIVKYVPAGLPSPVVPDLTKFWFIMIHSVSTIVLVAFMEAYAIAKKYAMQEEYALNVNQELTALGAANLIGSFFSAYPVSGSFSRTAVSFSAGTNTQMANIVSAMVVMITLKFLTRFFYYIPRATLGAIIEVALINLLDFKSFNKEYKRSLLDLLVALVTFCVTLAFNTEYGLVAGLGTSLLCIYWMPRGGALLVRLWLRPSLARRQACDVVIVNLTRLYRAPLRIRRRMTDYLKYHRRARGASPNTVVVLDGEDLMNYPSGPSSSTMRHFLEKVIASIEKAGVPKYMIAVVGVSLHNVSGGHELQDVLLPAQVEIHHEVTKRAHSIEAISSYGAEVAAREGLTFPLSPSSSSIATEPAATG